MEATGDCGPQRLLAAYALSRTVVVVAVLAAIWRCASSECTIIEGILQARIVTGRLLTLIVSLLAASSGFLGLALEAAGLQGEERVYAELASLGIVAEMIGASVWGLSASVTTGGRLLSRLGLAALVGGLVMSSYGVYRLSRPLESLLGPGRIIRAGALPVAGGPALLLAYARRCLDIGLSHTRGRQG